MQTSGWVLISLLLLLVGGCGQKGDLYFPDSQAHAAPQSVIAGVNDGLF